MKIHEIKKNELLSIPKSNGELFLKVIQCINEEAHNQTGSERIYKCEIINIEYFTREQINDLTLQQNCLINFIN